MLSVLAERKPRCSSQEDNRVADRCAATSSPYGDPTMIAGRAHLVGVAGAGMRSLARLLVEAGWSVTGSDTALDGHDRAAIAPTLDAVIHSSAICDDNPELSRARELHIPTLSYAETLRLLMQGRIGLAVAGTHGKSTTAAMLAEILQAAALDPSFVFGAAHVGTEIPGGHCGDDPVFVVEACEYRRNFLHLTPQLAVITGIERDHFDCYADLAALEQAFEEFADRVSADGVVIARAECAASRRATSDLAARVATFGLASSADWRAAPLGVERGLYRFRIEHQGSQHSTVQLQVAGEHNMLNALAAAAAAAEFGVPSEAIARGLASFRGLARRLETIGTSDGVVHIDDYAHHPTEVAAALAAIREMHPASRLWCVFQPHQVSRTEHLLDELAASLQNADNVLVADVFAAREPAGDAVRRLAVALAERVARCGAAVVYRHDAQEIVTHLARELQPGDVLATMGAGDIRKVQHGVLDRVRGIRAAA